VLTSFANWYEDYVKDAIRHLTQMRDPELHLVGGMLLLVVAAAVMRKPLSSGAPLAAVAGAEAFNEVLDRISHGDWQSDTGDDIVRTLALPVAVFLAARLVRGLMRVGWNTAP
jgi:predicted NBD/HSP70 family sugar kinase